MIDPLLRGWQLKVPGLSYQLVRQYPHAPPSVLALSKFGAVHPRVHSVTPVACHGGMLRGPRSLCRYQQFGQLAFYTPLAVEREVEIVL